MKPEVSINFCVRSNFRTKEETYPVFVSGRVKEKRGYIGSTDIRVPKGITISNNRPVGGTDAKRRQISSQIDKEMELLMSVVEYLKGRNRLSLENLKNLYKSGGVENFTFSDLLKDYLGYQAHRVGGTITKGSYDVYANVGNNFCDFLEHCHKSQIPIDDITQETIQEYITYLTKTKNRKPTTVNNLISILKSYFIYAVEKEYIQKSPMTSFGYRKIPSSRVFLTKSEVGQLAHCELSSKVLSHVRDCYLLSCWTGLSYSDLRSLSLSELVEISDRTWIYKSRKKTHVPFAIPLIPPALALINRYADKEHPFDPIFRKLPDNSTCNKALKEIAKEAGIAKHLTFHTARHTFATMALSEGVSMESVSKMLGHASITTTAIYARITNEKVAREMAVFERNLCESEL